MGAGRGLSLARRPPVPLRDPRPALPPSHALPRLLGPQQAQLLGDTDGKLGGQDGGGGWGSEGKRPGHCSCLAASVLWIPHAWDSNNTDP